jgi:hypothetical protein
VAALVRSEGAWLQDIEDGARVLEPLTLLAKEVTATAGPAAAPVKSDAGRSVIDRESPCVTFLTGTWGYARTRLTARTVQGWPASGPGRLRPDPCLLTRGGAEAPALKGGPEDAFCEAGPGLGATDLKAAAHGSGDRLEIILVRAHH